MSKEGEGKKREAGEGGGEDECEDRKEELVRGGMD